MSVLFIFNSLDISSNIIPNEKSLHYIWTNTKYSFSKLQWIFFLIRRFYLSSFIDNIFNGLDYMSNIGRAPGLMLLIFLEFLCCVFVLFVFALWFMPNIACVSGLSILDCPFRFLSLYLKAIANTKASVNPLYIL